MKLWLISQDKNNGYDTYDSAVVAAKSVKEAVRMYPSNGMDITVNPDRSYAEDSWVTDPNDVKCRYLGEAAEGTEKCVICASFNAG